MRTPHSSTRKGKTIYVVLRDGTRFIDKFVEKKGAWVLFENHKVHMKDLRSFGINRSNNDNKRV